MICFFCHRPIRGADVAKRYEWRNFNGKVFIYGQGAPDGPLSKAFGQLVKLSHNKCYHADKKQQELVAARAADPSAQPGPGQDWRHQEVLDVEDLKGAGD